MSETLIPSLADLALQYGTIDKVQYKHITSLHALKIKENRPQDYSSLLMGQRFATGYQISLLKLIQDYHAIKVSGREFGKIAVEKGYATEEDVRNALDFQRREFKRARLKKLIGDILVESRVITEKQKNQVLKEQTFLERKASKIREESQGQTDPGQTELELSDYERQFLKVKALDIEFAASVLEKGFASKLDIEAAQETQEFEFETNQTIKTLGNIMVEMQTLTLEQQNIILKEQNRPIEQEEEAIQIHISPDLMEARVRISKTGQTGVNLAMVKENLASQGITHGIYPDAVLQCHLENRDLEFTAAYQDFSENLIQARKTAFLARTGLEEKDETRKGEELTWEKTGPVECEGINIKGEKTRSQELGRNFTFRSGPGTRLSRDGSGIFAAKSGTPFVSIARKIFIHPALHVLEDLDLKYGEPPEPYANLNISGILTGAFPITAGRIKATEIRGARIEAMGDVRSDVGITDSFILTHGDIHARYLHNCVIISFGNVNIRSEIFDSRVFCAGRVESPQCRLIDSRLYAKKGIHISGAGSKKTAPCTLCAGSEHYLIEFNKYIARQMEEIESEAEDLKKEKQELEHLSKKTFQKMIELKMFHDRAKEKKQTLLQEYKAKKNQTTKEKQKNFISLIKTFESRMMQAVASIKKSNASKKKYEDEIEKIENEILSLKKKNKNKILSLEQDLYSFYEWAREKNNSTQIKISGKAFQGTMLKGIFSEKKLDADFENFCADEIQENGQPYIQIQTTIDS